jgi:hypothetical protein
MAEGGKKLFNVDTVACRARDFLVTEDQDLKVLFALHAMIFKDRHV